MNTKLLEYLEQLKNAGTAPQRTPQQSAELGMPDKDVDNTLSPERLSYQTDEFSETPPDIERKVRMQKIMNATTRGDSEEVARLRQEYKDEMEKLNTLVTR